MLGGGSGEPIWVSGGRNEIRDWLNWHLFRDDDREPWLHHLVRKLDVEEAWNPLLHQFDTLDAWGSLLSQPGGGWCCPVQWG